MRALRSTAAVALIALAALAPAARAAGPPLLGGETKVRYTGTPKGGGEARVEVDAGTDTITYLWLRAPRVTRCGSGSKHVWREEVGLVNAPFHIGRGRHVVKRETGTYPGDRTTWDLRFDAAWNKVTLTYTTHFRHNYLGRCSGKARIVAKHVLPTTWWQLGAYAGTTGQGQPIAFTASSHSTRAGKWTYTDFLARDLKTTVTFTCDDRFTAARELALDLSQEAGANGAGISEGSLGATLTPGGVAREKLGGTEHLYAELAGKIAGTKVSGTITPNGEHAGADGATGSCYGQPIAFSATRTG